MSLHLLGNSFHQFCHDLPVQVALPAPIRVKWLLQALLQRLQAVLEGRVLPEQQRHRALVAQINLHA